MHIPAGDTDKRGNVAVQVQQGVHLDRGLAPAKLRPRKHGQLREADHRHFFALQVIHMPQEGPKNIRPQVPNLRRVARRIFGLYHPRDRRDDFLQCSRDSDRVQVPSNKFLQPPQAPRGRLFGTVNSIEAEETARTFSRHCGYKQRMVQELFLVTRSRHISVC